MVWHFNQIDFFFFPFFVLISQGSDEPGSSDEAWAAFNQAGETGGCLMRTGVHTGLSQLPAMTRDREEASGDL